MTTVAIRGAAEVVTCAGDGPMRGEALRSLGGVSGMDVGFDGGVVAALGSVARSTVEIDAGGCTLVPGFVDPHTHLPFHGWRADEDAARLAGLRYESLHREEGGIYRSARMLAGAPDDDVLTFSADLAGQMLRAGTTTFETKSGYGLSIDGELRHLRLARRLADLVPQEVVTTCLAAHAVPKGMTEGGWVGRIATDLLPIVADEGLASACDVYVETIAFQLEHAARLASAAGPLGLRMRMHADQLEDSQAASFAARWGFASADHLNHTSLASAGDLAASDTAAVLLPGATFTLRQNVKPPVRNLVDGGAIVALGTDLNPGTSPIHSMPFAIALACRTYGLRPMEALAAATVNSAHVIGLGERVGRLVEGYRGDAVVLALPSFETIVYRPDHRPVAAVVCGGELAYAADWFEDRIAR